jgi:hypothetical protein
MDGRDGSIGAGGRDERAIYVWRSFSCANEIELFA